MILGGITILGAWQDLMITFLVLVIYLSFGLSFHKLHGLNFRSNLSASSRSTFQNGWYQEYLAQQKLILANQIEFCQPNGMKATPDQRSSIESLVKLIEKMNPIQNPAKSEKMNGNWVLLYTDLNPPAPSSGKLGPFTGKVYQQLDSVNLNIKNVIKVGFPPITGILEANIIATGDNLW